MSRTFFFAGHETLSNRGCEALLRGITTILRQRDPAATFLVPSFDPGRDRRHWPQSEAAGVVFVPAYRLPRYARLWARAEARMPTLRKLWLPTPGLPPVAAQAASAANAGIMTGGDVLSLDYGVPSLVRYLGQAADFARRGRDMHLWAASVGPFPGAPDLEQAVVRSLRGYASLSVRESATQEYLHGLGLTNVVLAADPAFVMTPEPWADGDSLPAARGDGMLGFNISPLIRKLLSRTAAGAAPMEEAVIAFWKRVLEKTEFSIVLVPHVDSRDGGTENSDHAYMSGLLARADLPRERVVLASRQMNAAQVKHLIAQCRFFIGARTHATIAAWSTGVPTLSLGYSVKARGLNRDLFGDERFLLDTKKITLDALVTGLSILQEHERATRALLADRIPKWRERASTVADLILGAR